MKKDFLLGLIVFMSLALCGGALASVTITGDVPDKTTEGAYDIKQFAGDAQSGKIRVIDVRTPNEFVLGHLPEAINIPMTSLEDELKSFSKDKTVVFMCVSGRRAGKAYNTVMEKAPHMAGKVFFLDATTQYSPDNSLMIKPNPSK